MTMNQTVQLLIEDWRNRLTDADYRTQDGLTYSFTLLEALNSVDPDDPDFSEVTFGLDQLRQLEDQGGWDEGTPPGDEPFHDIANDMIGTIKVINSGVVPSGVV